MPIARPLAGLLAAAGLALTAAAPAHAQDDGARTETTGLAWKWDQGQKRTFHIKSEIQLPRFIWLRAFNNLEVRGFGLKMQIVTTCEAAEQLGKRGWELNCLVDDLSLQAVAVRGDQGQLDRILAEWDERLTGEKLEVVLDNDGELRDVNYVDLTRRNRRDGENMEYWRQVLLRLFSPMDLELPKKGTDKGEGQWKEKNPLVISFPSFQGSVGSVDITHAIEASRGGLVRIASSGKGTLGNASSTKSTGGNEEISDFFEMDMVSSTTFNTEQGTIVKREVAARGVPTASSALAEGTEGLPYIQAYFVELLPEGAPRPTLPPSKEIDGVFPGQGG